MACAGSKMATTVLTYVTHVGRRVGPSHMATTVTHLCQPFGEESGSWVLKVLERARDSFWSQKEWRRYCHGGW